MKTYYKCKKIIYEAKEFQNKYLVVEDGKIDNIIDWDLEVNGNVVDYSKFIIAPGYIDTHIHGIGGADTMDATTDAFEIMAKALVKHGVTGYYPTPLTSSVEDLNKVVEVIGNLDKESIFGAEILGIMFEGPFFTEKYKGAQNPKYLLDPNIELLKKWKELSKDLVMKIAIAPEREGSIDFIKKAIELGIIVSIGHSNASYEESKKAFEVGASIVNHTYNGMSPFNHRDVGMVGAALLSDDKVYCEIITDTIHLSKEAFMLLYKMKGYKNIVLITDCMRAGAMPDGVYKLGEFDVTVKDGAARLKEGNLAGSILTMDVAVKNIVNKWDIPLVEAINMATYIPAISMKVDDKVGILKKGRVAHFNVLDNDLNVLKTYMNGKLINSN